MIKAWYVQCMSVDTVQCECGPSSRRWESVGRSSRGAAAVGRITSTETQAGPGSARHAAVLAAPLLVPLVLALLAALALLLARPAMRRGRGRLAPLALLHINIMLALYAGAGLATAARLKWDPTTYIAVRELFPREYHVAAGALCAGAGALLALAHLAAAPLCLPARTARALYLLYAGSMCALLALEVGWAVWTARSIAAWLRSEQAAQMMELAELRQHLQPILQILAKYHPLPDKISDLIEEAETDAPRNLHAAGGAALLLLVLQPLAAVVALLAARASPPPPSARPPSPPPSFDAHDGWSYSRSVSESAPLKAKFKDGKLVMV